VRLNDIIHGRRRPPNGLQMPEFRSATEHAAEECFSAVETMDLGLLANRHPMTNQTYRVSAQQPSCTAPRRAPWSTRGLLQLLFRFARKRWAADCLVSWQ
jgi:hypothetical protein